MSEKKLIGEVYEALPKGARVLYGVKCTDECNTRLLVVCASLRLADVVEEYIKRTKDLFFSIFETDTDKELIKTGGYDTIVYFSECLDTSNKVKVNINQFAEEFAKKIKDRAINNEVYVNVINDEYIEDVID